MFIKFCIWTTGFVRIEWRNPMIFISPVPYVFIYIFIFSNIFNLIIIFITFNFLEDINFILRNNMLIFYLQSILLKYTIFKFSVYPKSWTLKKMYLKKFGVHQTPNTEKNVSKKSLVYTEHRTPKNKKMTPNTEHRKSNTEHWK